MNNILKNEKAMIFLGGVAAGTIGAKVLKSKAAKKLYVSTLANGIKLQQDAQQLFETMKEDAEDMCCEARKESTKECECEEK
jgi:IMP cyclohydrolase